MSEVTAPRRRAAHHVRCRQQNSPEAMNFGLGVLTSVVADTYSRVGAPADGTHARIKPTGLGLDVRSGAVIAGVRGCEVAPEALIDSMQWTLKSRSVFTIDGQEDGDENAAIANSCEVPKVVPVRRFEARPLIESASARDGIRVHHARTMARRKAAVRARPQISQAEDLSAETRRC